MNITVLRQAVEAQSPIKLEVVLQLAKYEAEDLLQACRASAYYYDQNPRDFIPRAGHSTLLADLYRALRDALGGEGG